MSIYLKIGESNSATSMCDFSYVKVVGQEQYRSWLCRFASILEMVLETVALRQDLPHGNNTMANLFSFKHRVDN